jgi:molybdate transport system permease protein
MSNQFIETMSLTFRLATITTIILFILAIPIAYWLSNTKSKYKVFIEALVSMPLVLPPSVLGFYMLLAFSPNNFFGKFLSTNFDISLAFSFEGLVIASVIFSLPFMIHPIQSGFASLPKSLQEASFIIGKSRFTTITKVLIPNIKPSILSAIVITFAHTVGEFGVVLMIGGNIPGVTKVASIAIYDEVESMNYAMAHQYAFVLFIITFTVLISVYAINKKIVTNSIGSH